MKNSNYSDGRRHYGDELGKALHKLSPDSLLAVIIGNEDIPEETMEVVREAANILADGNNYYMNMIIPKITLSVEEVGFIFYEVEHIAEALRKILEKECPRAIRFRDIVSSFSKIAIQDEYLVRKEEDDNAD
jgi:hypothetical protein